MPDPIGVQEYCRHKQVISWSRTGLYDNIPVKYYALQLSILNHTFWNDPAYFQNKYAIWQRDNYNTAGNKCEKIGRLRHETDQEFKLYCDVNQRD